MCEDFGIASEHVIYGDVMLRHEINLNVIKVADENEKDRLLWKALADHRGEKVLVYVDLPDGAHPPKRCMPAQGLGYSADFFHAELTSEAKAEVIRRFKAGELTVVFATNAFGMGIDIPDIQESFTTFSRDAWNTLPANRPRPTRQEAGMEPALLFRQERGGT